MVDYLEILRLKHLGYSQRQIIGSVGCSSHTIKDTWEAAQELNLQWPMPENTTNEELKKSCSPIRASLATQWRLIGLVIQSLITTLFPAMIIQHTYLLLYCPAVYIYMLQYAAI